METRIVFTITVQQTPVQQDTKENMMNILNTSMKPQVCRISTPVRAVLTTLILAIALTGSAAADTWTLGFGFGTSGLEKNEADLEFRTEVRGGYYFTPRFAIEGQLTRATGILDATLDTLMLNGIFELRPDKAVAPYILAGAGAVRMEDFRFFSDEPSVTSDGTAFQAAIGARFYFGEEKRMGLQVELSRLLENSDILDRDQHTSLTAGMTWKLGG